MTREEQIEQSAYQYGNCFEQHFELASMAFIKGAQWADAHLWHPADGDDLPELEREVVVFTKDFPNDAGIMRVGIAHRPDSKGWDGRNILTGEVNHYTPKTYDKGGWSIPDVKIWLDCPMPYEEGGEE